MLYLLIICKHINFSLTYNYLQNIKALETVKVSRAFLEAPPRFELGIKVLQTSALPLGYSAINGAEDEIRTRDVHLGKVTLYH